MKWAFAILFLLLFLSLGFLGIRRTAKKDIATGVSVKIVKETPAPTSLSQTKENISLFVPYWGLGKEGKDIIDTSFYNSLLYFGITPKEDGINTEDEGYKKIDNFLSATNTKTSKYLVIRMVDSKLNFDILKNKTLQQAIIADSIKIAKNKGFSWVVVDLEVSSLPFNSVTSEMNSFIQQFSQEVKKNNLQFGITLFGDTFLRIRPYDVQFLQEKADMVFLMAYDFHKISGDPGPNFPLSGREIYRYDFKTMITDFLNFIPAQKITVVFGMFGYDWTLDKEGKVVKNAESLTLSQIDNTFLGKCKFKKCEITRDLKSAETKINYTDLSNQNHTVWFEDTESVNKKKEFLKEKGINSTSFWAYSYF